jgi:aldehyde dehydrogenase (NAD+)
MTDIDAIADAIDRVREGFAAGVVRAVSDRETQLRQLRRMLIEQEDVFAAALKSDLGKSALEAYSTEIGYTIGEIDHTLRHIRAWTQPQRVKLPLHLRPGSARIMQEPLGTVLVIAPWNYPVQLLLRAAVPALAAGNTAVLKPSEVTEPRAERSPRSPRYLDERAVQVVTGGVAETTVLLAARWDHIFYTGNGTVGRIVMRGRRRAPHPGHPRTGRQEPGDRHRGCRRRGRCATDRLGQVRQRRPDLRRARLRARRRGLEDKFVGALRTSCTTVLRLRPGRTRADYARIVNERHHERLAGLLDAGGFDEVCRRRARRRHALPRTDGAGGREARCCGHARGDLRADPAGLTVTISTRRSTS